MPTSYGRLLAAIPVLLLLLHCPSGDAATEQKDPIVIELGDTVVTRDELNDRFRVAVRLLAQQQVVALSKQNPAVIERLRKQYLDKYSTELVLLQEAVRRNIAVPESEVAAAVAKVTSSTNGSNVNSNGNFFQGLKDAGVDGKAELHDIVRDEKTVALVVEQLLKEIDIAPGDVITFHHDMQGQMTKPEEVCVRHIQTDTLEAANKIIAELHDGADFAELAKKSSTDLNRANSGGDLGCFEKGHSPIGIQLEIAAFDANEGDIVGPVTTADAGYQVIKVYKHTRSHVPTLNEAYDQIARTLAEEELPNRIGALVKASGIRTYPERFAAERTPD